MKNLTPEEINNMTPEKYHEFLDTIDPDAMGFDEKVEGVKTDAD